MSHIVHHCEDLTVTWAVQEIIRWAGWDRGAAGRELSLYGSSSWLCPDGGLPSSAKEDLESPRLLHTRDQGGLSCSSRPMHGTGRHVDAPRGSQEQRGLFPVASDLGGVCLLACASCMGARLETVHWRSPLEVPHCGLRAPGPPLLPVGQGTPSQRRTTHRIPYKK